MPLQKFFSLVNNGITIWKPTKGLSGIQEKQSIINKMIAIHKEVSYILWGFAKAP